MPFSYLHHRGEGVGCFASVMFFVCGCVLEGGVGGHLLWKGGGGGIGFCVLVGFFRWVFLFVFVLFFFPFLAVSWWLHNVCDRFQTVWERGQVMHTEDLSHHARTRHDRGALGSGRPHPLISVYIPAMAVRLHLGTWAPTSWRRLFFYLLCCARPFHPHRLSSSFLELPYTPPMSWPKDVCDDVNDVLSVLAVRWFLCKGNQWAFSLFFFFFFWSCFLVWCRACRMSETLDGCEEVLESVRFLSGGRVRIHV